MANTPAEAPPRFSGVLRQQDVEISEEELGALLQQALDPTFVLVRRLGAGGMGVVYLARDPALKRMVAVKVMLPERAFDPDARARFQREAESVAAISHPNVVAVHSVGALSNGIPYLVMQYVEGPSMADRLRDEGPLDLPAAKQILGQVASALEAAHRKGIIHRDIKAANILWDETAGRALVTDFGIAAILERDFDQTSSRLTQTGMVMGTPRYMSPEQLLSEPVTERSDIYSLGLFGYELLTGEGPYQVTSPNQMVAAHLRDAPRPLSLMRPDVDPVLESLLAGCLEKDAFGRPSAEDVARRLQHGASVLLEWPPPGLEDLQGACGQPLSRLLAGAAAIVIPLTIVATAGRDSGLRPGWPAILALPIVAAMGGVSVLFAAADFIKLARTSMRAARAGYGWGIIAEVLVDTEKDTGALITGDREYAALSTEQRGRIRGWRVLRAGLRGGAALWMLAGLLVGLPISVRVGGPGFLALWTLGVPVVMLAAARVLRWREDGMLAPIRSRLRQHRTPLDRLSHLAGTWRDAFDRMMPNVGRTHGAFGRIARRAAAIGAVAVAGLTGLVAATGFLTMAVGGEFSDQQRSALFNGVPEKASRIARLRPLRSPVDPAITPAQGGFAIQSITTAGGSPAASGLLTAVRHPLGPIELPAGTAPVKLKEGGVIRLTRSAGLTSDQRAYLRRVAALPGESEFSTLARAGVADWFSVMTVDPIPSSTSVLGLPLPKFMVLRTAAYAHIARAALAAEQGRTTEAERYLREVIGAGFTLMEGPTVLENLIGIGLVRLGRDELVSLYETTGRADLARPISAAGDPATDETLLETNPQRMDRGTREAYIQRVILDKTMLRGVRWEMVVTYLSYQPCSDMGQVLFGPTPIYHERMAEARKELVRTEGEERLMQLAEHALATYIPAESLGVPSSPGNKALDAFAKAVDAITGAKRTQACMSLRPFG